MSQSASLEATRSEITRLGAKFDGDVLAASRAAYAKLHDEGPSEQNELAYGSDPRQRLDLYGKGGGATPLLLFVHGGGFVSGDKRQDAIFHGNVGRFFARNGFLAAVMNYRLAPNHGWPAGASDVARALTWLTDHAAGLGARASKVAVIGQSAGASHVASALFDPQWSADIINQLGAVVLMSGFYGPEDLLSPGQRAYFGDVDPNSDRFPIEHVTQPGVPLMLTVAEYDPAPIARQTLRLALALTAACGACPLLHRLASHNHVSSVLSLGSKDVGFGQQLLQFLAAVRDV